MKPSTLLIQEILSSGQFGIAELYDLTLSGGQEYHFTSFDMPLSGISVLTKSGTAGPFTYSPGFVIRRDKVTMKLGTEAGEMEVIIGPQPSTEGNPLFRSDLSALTADSGMVLADAGLGGGAPMIAGYPIQQAARLGFLDGAKLQLNKLFINDSIGINTDAVGWFLGTVQDVQIDRFLVHLTANDALAYLGNQQMPRILYSVGCWHQVYDAGCTLLKSAFTVTATITSVVDGAHFTASGLSQAAGYFNQGVITFTGGNNAGIQGTVNVHGAGGVFTMRFPFPNTIQVGDAFSVYPGCDLQQATCLNKFNNLAHFAGQPYIPVPETIVDGGTNNPPVQTPGSQAGQIIGSRTGSTLSAPGIYQPGMSMP